MPTQTKATLYTLAETAINAVAVGASYSLPSAAVRADLHVDVAQVTTTTPANGTVIRIQGNMDASDETSWIDLPPLQTNTTAAATDTTTASISAAATTFATTGAATFGARTALLYLRDSSTAGEWVLQSAHASNTVSVPAKVQNAHSSGINVYSQAVRYLLSFDVTCMKRMRLIIDNNTQATGPTVAVFSEIETFVA